MILTRGALEGGSLFTAEHAEDVGKPILHIDLAERGERLGPASAELKSWILKNDAEIVNVAGPRESKAPGIADEAREFLVRALKDPETIEEAADKLVWELDDAQRGDLKALGEDDLINTHFGIAMYVRNTYGLFRKECPLLHAESFGDADDVSGKVVRRAWEKLRENA